MQIHGADVVQVTWMWDRAEFRRHAWRVKADQNRVRMFVVLVSATIAAWMIYLWQGGPFPYGAVWIALIAAALLLEVSLTGWAWLRGTGDAWYAPVTLRVDVDGVRLTAATADFLYRWPGLAPVARTADVWEFSSPGMGSITVPRRLISPADDAAIARVVDFHAHRVGRPADMPPPAEV